jgi:SAM-dependent methyltransferase
MDSSWLDWLRCPFCGGRLCPSGTDQATHAPGYDVLSCWCSRYPVVAGIPILKRGPDSAIEKLTALIDNGQYLEALLAAIAPADPVLAPAWMSLLPSIREMRWLKHLAHQRALRRWREQAAALVTGQGGRVTAGELFNLSFKRREAYNYFYFRFGQPRHLIALSFASLIHQPKKAILDLACGCGHITRSLVQRAKGQPVIGVDNSFFGLYIAKHWIAPEAEYVCYTADSSLPFPNGAFSVVFCSDAFHYFAHKATVVWEFERLTQHDGLLILPRIHNALVRQPHDGQPLPPEGYQALMADIPHRLVADSDVLAGYRHKRGPSLARPDNMRHLAQAPHLSMVASHRKEVFRDYGPFEDWPHAGGRLGVNPLFHVEEREESGYVHLRRLFPSVFYEEQHAACKDYLPETVKIPSDLWANLSNGTRGPELERLIEQCVAIGMPERYREDSC